MHERLRRPIFFSDFLHRETLGSNIEMSENRRVRQPDVVEANPLDRSKKEAFNDNILPLQSNRALRSEVIFVSKSDWTELFIIDTYWMGFCPKFTTIENIHTTCCSRYFSWYFYFKSQGGTKSATCGFSMYWWCHHPPRVVTRYWFDSFLINYFEKYILWSTTLSLSMTSDFLTVNDSAQSTCSAKHFCPKMQIIKYALRTNIFWK